MDYKSCPLKKRPIIIDIENDFPQDLSMRKRKATNDIPNERMPIKKVCCPLDLSRSSSSSSSSVSPVFPAIDLHYMNPINWHTNRQFVEQQRSETPLSIFSESSDNSRSSSVSPISRNNSQIYQSPSTWKFYQSIDSQQQLSSSSLPEDLSVQSFIPLPALYHGLSSDDSDRYQQHNNTVNSNCNSNKLSTNLQYYFLHNLQQQNYRDIPIDQKLHCCLECNKKYTTKSSLKMHIRTHTLPYPCEICNKSFSRPWLLKGHMRVHTGEKPFTCEYCAKAFADRSNLRSHLQTHATVKKHICLGCKKSFSRLSLLKKHIDDCNYNRVRQTTFLEFK